mmetsp:Transcript_4380/g.9459  ORF Transcript_4380/g.9459 Transcript_4380/m.9459 type:complete len:217 (-) Transcript_4380:13-663(-)
MTAGGHFVVLRASTCSTRDNSTQPRHRRLFGSEGMHGSFGVVSDHCAQHLHVGTPLHAKVLKPFAIALQGLSFHGEHRQLPGEDVAQGLLHKAIVSGIASSKHGVGLSRPCDPIRQHKTAVARYDVRGHAATHLLVELWLPGGLFEHLINADVSLAPGLVRVWVGDALVLVCDVVLAVRVGIAAEVSGGGAKADIHLRTLCGHCCSPMSSSKGAWL